MKKALACFALFFVFLILGILANAASFWPLDIASFCLAVYFVWHGISLRSQSKRLDEEENWHRKAVMDPGQPPLNPCCMQVKQSRTHDELRCTRVSHRPFRMNAEEISRAWVNLIKDLPDPEYGEDA